MRSSFEPHFALADDGVHFARLDYGGPQSIVVDTLDRSAPPRSIPFADARPPLALSPTGDRIAFASDDGRRVQIVRSDGSGLGLLLDGRSTVGALIWSPDGSRIAAIASPGDSRMRSELVILDTAGGPARKIDLPMPRRAGAEDFIGRDARAGVWAACWSPEGRRLALLLDRDGPCWSGGRDMGPSGCYASIYVVAADGTGLRRLSPRHQASGQLLWVR